MMIVNNLIVLLGILLPLTITTWILTGHNGLDATFNYIPLLQKLSLLPACGIIVLVSAIINLLFQKQIKKLTVVLAWISIAIIAYASFVLLVPQLVRHGDIYPQVFLTEQGSPGMAITFWTEKPTANSIKWGLPKGGQKELGEEKPSQKHWFGLTGLLPNTGYEYAVNGKKIGTFKTPPKGAPLRFAAAGDPHFGAPGSRSDQTIEILEIIKNPANHYAMFFLLGDTVQFGFNDVIWKEALKTLSVLTSVMPTFYVQGNHDSLFGGSRLFNEYILPPEKKDSWQRIDSGNVHFLILDLEWELNTYTKAQEKWLKNQLASIPQTDWCIVMSHTFFYASGSRLGGWDWFDNKKVIARLTPLFEQYNVDLVLSGHAHQAEVLRQNGVPYVVIGTLGGVLDPPRDHTSPASIWYSNSSHAFADVLIMDDHDAAVTVRDFNNQELFKFSFENH